MTEEEELEELNQQYREHVLAQVAEGELFVFELPDLDHVTAFQAAELGSAVLLGKPIVLVIPEGRTPSPFLDDIVAITVEADIHSEEGSELVQVAIQRVLDGDY